jgi:hypothetical protein
MRGHARCFNTRTLTIQGEGSVGDLHSCQMQNIGVQWLKDRAACKVQDGEVLWPWKEFKSACGDRSIYFPNEPGVICGGSSRFTSNTSHFRSNLKRIRNRVICARDLIYRYTFQKEIKSKYTKVSVCLATDRKRIKPPPQINSPPQPCTYRDNHHALTNTLSQASLVVDRLQTLIELLKPGTSPKQCLDSRVPTWRVAA